MGQMLGVNKVKLKGSPDPWEGVVALKDGQDMVEQVRGGLVWGSLYLLYLLDLPGEMPSRQSGKGVFFNSLLFVPGFSSFSPREPWGK